MLHIRYPIETEGKQSRVKLLPFLKAMPSEFGSKVHEQAVTKQHSKFHHKSKYPIKGHERAELTARWER